MKWKEKLDKVKKKERKTKGIKKINEKKSG